MNPFAPTHPQSEIPRQQKNRPCNRSGQPLTRNFDAIPEYGGLKKRESSPHRRLRLFLIKVILLECLSQE
jgi:hypothetical protein